MGKKEIWAIATGILLIIGFTVWGVVDSRNTGDVMEDEGESKDIVYYYGAECPHCKDVAAYLEENRVAEKVDYSKKEVWHDQKNNTEMMDHARECGLLPDDLGVPFLWARGECFIGAPDVIGYFEKEIEMEQNVPTEDDIPVQ